MYVYTLAKGVNLGYLPRDKYLPVIRKAWAGLTTELIRQDADGTISLLQCCEVAGLGLTSKGTGLPRDGSFEYYIGEPIIENDLKGVGPFILAGIELDKLLAAPRSPAQGHVGSRPRLGRHGRDPRPHQGARVPEARLPDHEVRRQARRIGRHRRHPSGDQGLHARPAAAASWCLRESGTRAPSTSRATSTSTSPKGRRCSSRPTRGSTFPSSSRDGRASS